MVELVPCYHKERVLVLVQVVDSRKCYLRTVEIQNGLIMNVVKPDKSLFLEDGFANNSHFCGAVDDNLVFVALDCHPEREWQIEFFSYDLRRNFIKGLEHKRISGVERHSSRLCKLGDNFWSVTNSGKICKLVSSRS